MYASGRPEILLAAASDRQAGRLFAAASRFVRRHEGLSQALRVRVQVSVSSGGRQANGGSSEADGETTISADGRFVAFSSSASNLVAGDTNKATDVGWARMSMRAHDAHAMRPSSSESLMSAAV